MSTTKAKKIKIALVTGGGRGLGRATVLSLAEAGNDAIVTYLSNKAAADEVVTAVEALGQQAVALPLDSGKTATFAAFATNLRRSLEETWNVDRFDFLVNNAGIGTSASFAETTEAQFDELMNVHFKGVFFLTQTLLPLIADGGRIVNLSTGLTRISSLPGFAAYASMKGAIEVLTRHLAAELGPRKIAVNSFAPGAIATDFAGGFVRDNANVNAHIASTIALGRVGLPDDIGPAIASLLGEDNRWINAQRIEASGGQML